MSIIILGMKMPKNCITCPFMVSRENDDCILQSLEANAHAESWEQLREGCPLIELPPHGRLIDADKLERMFADIDNAPYSGFDGEDPFYSADDAVQIIRLAPTILPADPEGGADG